MIEEWHAREDPSAAAATAPELYRAAVGGGEQLVTELIDAGRTDELPALAGVCARLTAGVLGHNA